MPVKIDTTKQGTGESAKASWAPMRLDAAAQDALRATRRTFTKGGVGELRVALAGLGHVADLRGLRHEFAGALQRALGPAGGAPEWVSASPFVPPALSVHWLPTGNTASVRECANATDSPTRLVTAVRSTACAALAASVN